MERAARCRGREKWGREALPSPGGFKCNPRPALLEGSGGRWEPDSPRSSPIPGLSLTQRFQQLFEVLRALHLPIPGEIGHRGERGAPGKWEMVLRRSRWWKRTEGHRHLRSVRSVRSVRSAGTGTAALPPRSRSIGLRPRAAVLWPGSPAPPPPRPRCRRSPALLSPVGPSTGTAPGRGGGGGGTQAGVEVYGHPSIVPKSSIVPPKLPSFQKAPIVSQNLQHLPKLPEPLKTSHVPPKKLPSSPPKLGASQTTCISLTQASPL